MKPVPNRAGKRVGKIDVKGARLKAERAALNDSSGKFATGALQNKGEKRARTRDAATRRAIREDMN